MPGCRRERAGQAAHRRVHARRLLADAPLLARRGAREAIERWQREQPESVRRQTAFSCGKADDAPPVSRGRTAVPFLGPLCLCQCVNYEKGYVSLTQVSAPVEEEEEEEEGLFKANAVDEEDTERDRAMWTRMMHVAIGSGNREILKRFVTPWRPGGGPATGSASSNDRGIASANPREGIAGVSESACAKRPAYVPAPPGPGHTG